MGWFADVSLYPADNISGEIQDVVARHHQRNRPPRLPSNARLLAARNRQLSQHARTVSRANSVDELETPVSHARDSPSFATVADANVTPDPQPTPAIVPTMLGENKDSSQLGFYPPAIRDVIERAKQLSHCDIASINSFPLRPQFSTKAVEYMDEALAERKGRGLIIPNGYWPEYMTGIVKHLWEDIGNWRSSLKKKARTFVRQSYEWDPQNRSAVNADIARTLLDHGVFLMNGTDEDGRTNNLTHPALAGLVVDFFYAGSNSIGTLFPEVFGTEVPRPAVALAATAIKLGLDEIVAEGNDVAFKCNIYTDVYLDIIGLMSKCDTAPIHRAKTKALRVQWAKMGTNGGTKGGTITGFDVQLD